MVDLAVLDVNPPDPTGLNAIFVVRGPVPELARAAFSFE